MFLKSVALLLTVLYCPPVQCSGSCDPNMLTVYRVYLNTMWSREAFPRQYPEWRPPAQWSKLIGRSHNSSYVLFRIGNVASDEMKSFAEQGNTNLLDQESQGEGGVMDEFNAPPVTEGQGQTQAEFFMDGTHSMVSLVARIVPSPDWFIGVDSFNLCENGLWMESVILEVDPLDAGSDNGFTFTSPNWPTIPQQPVSRITAHDPDHPANSFYYPDRPHHPPIATFRFVKVREYELARELDSSFSSSSASASRQIYHQVLPQLASRDRASTPPYASASISSLTSTFSSKTGRSSSSYGGMRDDFHRPTMLETNEVVSNDVLVTPETSSTSSDTGTDSISSFSPAKNALTLSLIDKINKRRSKKNRRGRKKMATRRRRDCVVTEWAEWTPCSKTCGIGEQQRTRDIKRHAKRRGTPCPLLTETKWCGSARNCIDYKYFNW